VSHDQHPLASRVRLTMYTVTAVHHVRRHTQFCIQFCDFMFMSEHPKISNKDLYRIYCLFNYIKKRGLMDLSLGNIYVNMIPIIVLVEETSCAEVTKWLLLLIQYSVNTKF
jgi:hypothetical protein